MYGRRTKETLYRVGELGKLLLVWHGCFSMKAFYVDMQIGLMIWT